MVSFGRASEVLSGRKKYCGLSCAGSAKAKHLHLGRNQSGSRNPNYKGGSALTAYQHKLRQKEKYPERLKARELAYTAFRRGKLKKSACEVCGDLESEAHHDDYSRPLDVRWLCPKHHRVEHSS